MGGCWRKAWLGIMKSLLLSRIDVVVLIAQDEDRGGKNWER